MPQTGYEAKPVFGSDPQYGEQGPQYDEEGQLIQTPRYLKPRSPDQPLFADAGDKPSITDTPKKQPEAP